MTATKRVLMRSNALLRRSIFNRPVFVRSVFGVDVAPDPTAQSYCEWATIMARLVLPRYLRHGQRVLDMGTGAHAVVAILAKKLRGDIHVIASDILADRIRHARETAQRNQVQLEFRVASLFDGLPERFDLVLFVPPVIPSRELGELGYAWHQMPGVGARRCWSSDGGSDGLEIIQPFLRDLRNHLADGGVALVTVNPSHCPRSVIRQLCNEGNLTIVRVHRMPGVLEVFVLERK